METPFRALTFVKGETITKDKMDQLQANYQWINDNTPRSRLFLSTNNLLDTRMVVIGGRVLIRRSRKRDDATVGVRFGSAFAPECRPNVTTGINADFQRQIFCVVNGFRGLVVPDATGCQIQVNMAKYKGKKDIIKKNFYVHWSAIGYRTDDMNEF